MKVVYQISIANISSMDQVISALQELGVSVVKHQLSVVKYNLELTFSEDASIHDVFAAGTYVGTIQTAALV